MYYFLVFSILYISEIRELVQVTDVCENEITVQNIYAGKKRKDKCNFKQKIQLHCAML